MARARNGAGQRPPRLKPGVKREQIIEVATEYFGQYGYEDTKWADVAEAVGIGSTALYHYFESKQHCLFEIMVRAVARLPRALRADHRRARRLERGARRRARRRRSTSPSSRSSATA